VRASRARLPGLLASSALLLAACASAPPSPAALDPGHDACGYCRMVVSDQRFASQVVAPSEEPRFFDDMGCLSRYLSGAAASPARARVYVADHRTKAWVPAERAVYTRVDSLTAPMGSHIVAHESAASRDADPAAAAGVLVDPQTVFAGRLPARESR
jgi:copper chaperone NosL